MKTKHLFLGLLTLVLADNTFGQSTSTSTTATGTLPSSPNQYLGFTNGADLIFKLGGTERMRLKNPMPATDPGGKLVLTGAISTTIPENTTSQAIAIRRSITNPGTWPLGTPIDKMGTGIKLEHYYRVATGTYTQYRWDLLVHNTGIRFHEAGNNAPSFVIENGGFVGIGTPDPTQKLNIKDGAILVEGANSYGGPMLLLGNNGSNNNTWGIENSADGLNFWRPFVGGQANQGNYFLFLKHSTGNVGINTNNPTARLSVNGTCLIGADDTQLPAGYQLYVQTGILTEKVKIAVKNTVNWADYVFEPTYKRMSLTNLEQYVTVNKHLPNIPSASEVEKEGVDVADMSNRLLEKIEELTLYIIEQDKKINELNKEVQNLKKN